MSEVHIHRRRVMGVIRAMEEEGIWEPEWESDEALSFAEAQEYARKCNEHRIQMLHYMESAKALLELAMKKSVFRCSSLIEGSLKSHSDIVISLAYLGGAIEFTENSYIDLEGEELREAYERIKREDAEDEEREREENARRLLEDEERRANEARRKREERERWERENPDLFAEVA